MCGKLMEDGHVSPASPTTRHLEPWVLSKGVWLGSLSPPQSTPLSEEPRPIPAEAFSSWEGSRWVCTGSEETCPDVGKRKLSLPY